MQPDSLDGRCCPGLFLTDFLYIYCRNCSGVSGTYDMGLFIPASVQGLILTVVAALPMAIFGILPQAVVADISQSDSITSGSNREGMFYAARTFAFKLGQSISMLIFTAVSTIGAAEGTGYRVAAFGAAVFCCIGGIILVFYNEKKINGIINRHQ